MLRRASCLAVLLLAASWTTPTRADEVDKEACASASEHAQLLRTAGRLRRALDMLGTCAQPSCPAIVRKDCVAWRDEIEAVLPSVTLRARDTNGNNVVAVHVLCDGDPLVETLDGRAVALDPGSHKLHFVRDSGSAVDVSTIVRQGEKNRVIEVVFPPEEPTKPREPDRIPKKAHDPFLTYLFAGIGLVAMGSFTYFGIDGRNDLETLRTTCAPYCSTSSVDRTHTKLLVADVSLGIGVVASGLATWQVLTHAR
jgi:hypothetical protein